MVCVIMELVLAYFDIKVLLVNTYFCSLSGVVALKVQNASSVNLELITEKTFSCNW